MIAIESSDLRAVDYDWSGTLTIEFHSGGVYEYFQVPHELYSGLMRASSPGSFFWHHIRDRFSYRRIR
ncbi:MAG: KTSC domain-containing protein [Verrucomicrobiota bacterium]